MSVLYAENSQNWHTIASNSGLYQHHWLLYFQMAGWYFRCTCWKTKHHVQNSNHLADELAKVVIDEEDILNSNDVVSLFTNTPIDQVLSIVKDRLEKEDVLRDYNTEQGFKLTSDDVVNLLEFILTATYFTFRGKSIGSYLAQRWGLQHRWLQPTYLWKL